MNSALQHERDPDGIVALTLVPNPAKPRGGVVVLDAWLIDELRRYFDALAKEPAPTGFILLSASPRVFVAGADLAEIDALDDAGLHDYLRAGADAFSRIARLPCPSVAAIHASVLGGGLEIAMHCDALINVATAAGDKPYLVGLPEAGLGICPGWGGTQMLPVRIDPATAIRATAQGQPWKSTEVPQGLFVKSVASASELRGTATDWLKRAPARASRSHPIAIDATNCERIRNGLEASRPTIAASSAATAVMDCVEVGIRHGWEQAVTAERSHLVRLRGTPEARAKLDAFLSKSGAKA